MPISCIIFDLDGTLIDSEPLGNQAYLDLIPELNDSLDDLLRRYRGQRFADTLLDISARIGKPIADGFEDRYRQHLTALFTTHLRTTPGTKEMLARLTLPMCVATNGPPVKARHALNVTGLTPFFGEHLFSAYDVGSWKPEPGLFLHAAQAMGFTPDQCVVVEDSEVGLRAAAAAGMRALFYMPTTLEVKDSQLTATSFNDMAQLPALIEKLAHLN